jgi:5-methylcytosine-specific restriction endonuclease McrA
MTKERQRIYDKYSGKCYLCGEKLQTKWHVDHLKPVRRCESGVMVHPENDTFENKMPACASCNINKHSMSLEHFREQIKGFMNHLNNHSTQYKLAKRYGLIQEVEKPVVFYFEQFQQPKIEIDKELNVKIFG